MKALLLTIILGTVLTMIGLLFYQQEVKYWLPTPVPQDYKEVALGSVVKLTEIAKGSKKFLHFYNPTCPCSKFNFESYRSLVRSYGRDFDLFVVVQQTAKGISKADKSFLAKNNIKIVVDEDKKLAKKLGVYATPQMVLMDENNKIFYRGNYNIARYCTNPKTNYAKMALQSMIDEKPIIEMIGAYTAYGCVLERDTH